MLKKGICCILAVLLVCGITACSGGKQAEQNSLVSSTVSTVDESATENQAQNTTAGKATKKESTTKKQSDKKQANEKTTTVADNTKKANQKSGSTQSASNNSGKKQSASKQTTAKKQTTTKKQSSTKKQQQTLAVTFTITCSAAVGKVDGVPASGYFLKGVGVSVRNGANVYEALVKCCDANGVSVVASNTMYGMYVSSIGGLAEFEAGKMSGWTYTVNGNYPPKACDKYVLSDGDKVEFIYKAG